MSSAKLLSSDGPSSEGLHDPHLYGNKLEDSPAYEAIRRAGLLVSEYRKERLEDLDLLRANTSKKSNLWRRLGYYLRMPVCGIFLYDNFYKEYLVPAGHVLKLRDEEGGYFLAGPGMHCIQSMFVYREGKPLPLERGHVQHGDCAIVTVEQGFIGFAMDRGQPVLLPPGMHQWKSDTLTFKSMIDLQDHCINLGPYTLLTVDEGYAAVTQNNGKQVILPGGQVHLLDHKNWKFEKFMTMKIQTDNLEKIQATSADNIIMNVTSTVNWRIIDVECAAILAAETMASTGRRSDVSADISKLRDDVLKQAIASLSSFIASVNYSDSFHLAAAAQASANSAEGVPVSRGGGSSGGSGGNAPGEGASGAGGRENPMFDVFRMKSAVEHANIITRRYGIEIMSINIISADPVDHNLTRALASGAVAAAEALQAETTARGNSKALKIEAEAQATALKIKAQAEAQAVLVKAEADMEAAQMLEKSNVAVDLAKINASAGALGEKSKLFFAKEPEYMRNLFSVQ